MRKSTTITLTIFINIVRNIIGAVRAKLLALVGGVAAVGLLGQVLTLFNFLAVIGVFSTKIALINTLTKAPKNEQPSIVISAALLVLVSNALLLLFCFGFARPLSVLLFKEIEYTAYIYGIVLVVNFFSIKEFFEAIDQANKHFKRIVNIQLASLLIALLALYPLILQFEVWGALLDMLLWLGLSILFNLPSKMPAFRANRTQLREVITYLPVIFRICLINVIRMLIIGMSLLFIRVAVVQSLDISGAGLFQAVWSIIVYIDVIMGGFLFYTHPYLSEVDKKGFNKAAGSFLELLLYLVAPILAILSLFPELVLRLLFTDSFTVVAGELKWLLCAKAADTLFMYYIMLLVVKNKMKEFLLFELLKGIMLVAFSFLGFNNWGLTGGVYMISFVHVSFFLAMFFWRERNMPINLGKRQKAQVAFFIAMPVVIALLPEVAYFSFLIKTGILGFFFVFVLDISRYYEFIRQGFSRFRV